MNQSYTPDAAESNAGDDFHILWAVTRCLKLINFDEGALKAVSVEGLPYSENSWLDTSGNMMLGVDLVEYYGGDQFHSAKKVIVSQLKYSTRTPNKVWTISRICTGRSGGTEGSIVERLARFYAKFSEQTDRGEILGKLNLKLVSNRPASKKLLSFISHLQNAIKKAGTAQCPDLKKLSAGLSPTETKALTKLLGASNLSHHKFLDFVSLLDFSDCGQDSRLEQEQKIIESISSLGFFKASKEFDTLHNLIWKKMMPDQAMTNTITLPMVLYAFGIHDISEVFPVKNEIQPPDNVVPRELLEDIKNEVLSANSSPICIHGGAGMGKSTLVNMLSTILPDQSVTLIFDCYGGGSYLDPEDRRHRHVNGIVQLCNELAGRIGTPPLLAREKEKDFYLKQFKQRVNNTAKIVRSINPDARISIILDAADNSVTAAEFYAEHTFVKDLLRMTFDDGCRIIVSSRTERMESLGLPLHTRKIEVPPFSYSETKAYLEANFPSVNREQIEEFRRLTQSVPRVMFYALELPGDGINDKMLPLKPDGKTLDQIFGIRIQEVGRRAEEKEVTSFLKHMICLPRPVPLKIIQTVSNLSDGTLSDIGTDFWREIVRRENEFTFRDEDFETYLRQAYPPTTESYRKIARALLDQAGSHEYASVHLAVFLDKSGMHATLKEIVLERQYLAFPIDPIKNKEVFVERARTAMKSSLADFNAQDFIKLQVVSAEAAKTNKVLEDILIDQPDLAAKYGNLQTNRKFYFQSGNPGWFGRAHYRNAAVYSREKETHEIAKQHLTKAREWLDYRKTLDDKELKKFRLYAQDLAFGAEAVFNVHGPDEAFRWISGWKPKSALYNVVEILIPILISNGREKEISKWLKANAKKLRLDIKLLVLNRYFELGFNPPFDIKLIFNKFKILKRIRASRSTELQSLIVSFCEYCLKNGIEYLKVKPLIDLIEIPLPSRPPSFHSGNQDEISKLDILLRKGIILNIYDGASYTSKDFYTSSLREKIKSQDYDARTSATDQVERFERVFNHLLPAYEIRSAIYKNVDVKELEAKIGDYISGYANDWEFQYYQRYDAPQLFQFTVLKFLDILFHERNRSLINSFTELINAGRIKNIDLLLAICEKVSDEVSFRIRIPEILHYVDEIIGQSALAGRELIEYFKRAAVVGSLCSPEDGKYYFDKMVNAANEIDLEAFDQLRSLHDISSLWPGFRKPDLAVNYFRFAEYCATRLSGWDGYPWRATIPTLSKFDVATAFAAVCQWDHRDVRGIKRNVFDLLHAAVKEGYIPPQTSVPLLAFNQVYFDDLIDLYTRIFAQIDSEQDHELKNAVLTQIIRDIKLQDPGIFFLTRFLQLIQDGRFTDKKIIDDFEEYLKQAKDLAVEPENPSEIAPQQSNLTEKYEELIRKVGKVDQMVFEKSIEKAKDIDEYIDYEALFTAISNCALPEHYLTYLDALLEVEALGISYYSFEIGLKILLEKWSVNVGVQSWRKTASLKIVSRWFPIFFHDDYFSYDTLQKLGRILGLNDRELSEVAIKIIPEYVDKLSPAVQYQMLPLACPLLDPDERECILSWILSRWNERIPNENMIFSDSGDILISGNADSVVAQFLRYHLGHPNKKQRWLTLHVLRRLALLKSTAILRYLLEHQDEKTCNPFQDEKHTFFWISAKLFLWMAIERISNDDPSIITPFRDYLVAEMNNKKLPHALIKWFVRRIALRLAENQPELFSQHEIDQFQVIRSSPFDIQRVKTRSHRNTKSEKSLKFRFDVLDTLPYWYQPLGSIFDVDEYSVATIAEKYISEYWGYTGNVDQDDHVVSSNYGETNSRHRSEPRVESLRTYYEYHAMFCAASELLNTRQITVKDDSYGPTWQEWIGDWGTCWDGLWLSDFRDPLPLERRFRVKEEAGQEWEWAIQRADFDEVLNFDDSEAILVYLGATIYKGKDYESISVASGLVNRETGRALLRTFQTRSASDNYIPFEKDQEEDFENERDTPPEFDLTPWLLEIKTERDGIDDNDPLYNGISKSRITPGSLFQTWSQCVASKDYRLHYREIEGADNWISKLEAWSNLEERTNYNDVTSSGIRLKIKRNELKSFLNDMNKDLIIKVEMRRWIDYERRKYSEYYPNYSIIYLLRADGSVETLAGNHKSW
ncbi:NACHT domain-containing protein [Parapedobacter sp. GCM10030251]|uniref:NACHT domain-containing protein n=1 Tax=Parapedobacter sp. GCM10030251 TaxID=3273419 RepID=UPI00361A7A44